ncbi:MAG: aldose epimerase family protein [Cyclobacteriaceae bacterium]
MKMLMIAFGALLVFGCTSRDRTSSTMVDPTRIQTYTLSNKMGVEVTLTNFGGKVISLFVPDREGNFDDVVLGYDSVTQYVSGNPYFGALIGRYANRIANSEFGLDGENYQLAANNDKHALHGGPNGFHNVIWDAKEFEGEQGNSLELSYVSEDGEEGYPGEVSVMVRYTLTESNELIIDYRASTSKSTPINLTHHSFFNLAGEGTGEILGHELRINAEYFTPVDEALIPTGELQPVAGTPFDFREVHTIGERIAEEHQQLAYGNGYDHNFVINKEGLLFSMAAFVREPASGRTMEVWTTEPGLQFYSGNFLDGSDVGKGGKRYGVRSAFCLEAQHFPNSPNEPIFPNTILRPGEEYRQKTLYRFGVE